MSYDLWEFIGAPPPLPESRKDQIDDERTIYIMLNFPRAGALNRPPAGSR